MDESGSSLRALGQRLIEAGLDPTLWARAESLALERHGHQQRNDLSPYLEQLVAVAELLATWALPPRVALVGLLHEVTTAGGLRLAQAQRWLGDLESETLLDAVHRSAKQVAAIPEAKRVETLRELFAMLAANSDAALIHCASALVALRAARDGKAPMTRALVATSQEVTQPLLERLGLWDVRGEIADHVLRLRDPERFAELSAWRDAEWNRAATQERVAAWEAQLQAEFAALPLALADDDALIVRPRLPSSINRSHHLSRIESQAWKLDDRHLFTTFVLVDSIDDAYRALRAVHRCGPPVVSALRDYFAQPRENGYAALHTSVVRESIPLNVRITTRRLYPITREGILTPEARAAATTGRLPSGWEAGELEALRGFLAYLRDPARVGLPLFTPMGDAIVLDAGATVLDFAYAIHTQVGDTAHEARVNGEVVPLHFRPHPGDVVEIVRESEPTEPDERKLEWVALAASKAKVQRQLRRRPWARGQTMLDAALRTRGRPLKEYLTRLADVAAAEGMEARQLYEGLARRDFSAEDLADRLISGVEPREGSRYEIELVGEAATRFPQWHPTLVRLAGCCTPSRGESIVARLLPSGHFEVHHAGCQRLAEFAESERVPVEWASQGRPHPRVELMITAQSRRGLVHAITGQIRDLGGEISYLEGVQRGQMDVVRLRLQVVNEFELLHLVRELRRVESVLTVSVDGKSSDRVVERVGRYFSELPPIPMFFSPGLPMKEDRFFVGRDEELQAIEHFLDTPTAVAFHLDGPKRIGKSSLLRRIGTRPFAREKLIYVFVDFQGLSARTLPAALRYVASRVHRAIDRRFQVALPSVARFEEEPLPTFSNYLGDQLQRIRRLNRQLTLTLDEMGVLLEALDQGKLSRDFFTALRHVHEEHELNLILCTSIDVERLPPDSRPAALFPNPVRVKLGPLNEEAARELLHRPLRGFLYYEVDALDELVRVTGAHPFYLHILGANLIAYMNEVRRRHVTLEDVSHIVTERTMLTGDEFAHLYESELELRLLQTLATSGERESGMTAGQLRNRLGATRPPLDELISALDNLVRRGTLCRMKKAGSGLERYRFQVPLFASWLHAP